MVTASKKEVAGGDKTLYIRDLQGNIMATYVYPASVPDGEDQEFTLQEHHIYGSSRLGIVKAMPDNTTENHYQQYTSYTHYELSNHLGNVMATITDHKTLVLENGFFSHYEAVVVSATDYYPFGWSMPGRKIEGEYRFGFNGKENDDEWGKQDFHARIYDGRVGRWLSMDPMAGKYPQMSPYIGMGDNPLIIIDRDGRDIIILLSTAGAHGTGHMAILVGNEENGWTYISKDGYTGNPFNKSEPIYIVKNFESVDEFRNSPHNFELKEGIHSTIDGKEPKRFRLKLDKKGNKIQRYDKALYISTTQIDGSSTDNETVKAAKSSAQSSYQLMVKDCSDVVTDALKKSKDSNGNQIRTGEFSGPDILTTLRMEQPKNKFDKIEGRNSKAINYDEEIEPDNIK